LGEKDDWQVRAYSENFKRKMIQRMSGPSGRSANSLAKEIGVPNQTLSRWMQQAAKIPPMAKKDDHETPKFEPVGKTRSPEDKMRLVLEASRLADEELGTFLRREGLHEADLSEWRDAMISGLKPPPSKHVRSQEVRRVRELEKELRRKDKALAEAAALLVLQKKVQALWGDEDDDTAKEKDE
jgi:transposase-like protein